MITPSLLHPKERIGPAERPSPVRSPEPVSESFASPLLGLQRTAGNLAVGHLLGGRLRQPTVMVQRKAPQEPSSEPPVAEREPAVALVVDDETETPGPGQMKKSEFFTLLRAEVCAAAEAGLAGTRYSAQGCPLIEFWLGYYEGQDTARINRDLPRFAGEGPRPESAEDYVGLIAERVATGVGAWARTGEITGVPKGIPLPGMGLPGLGSLGGLLGGLGGVLFKARPGGARDPGDPAALQSRLGAGRPLDGAIRSRMESAFGRGFSHVRVHADGGAPGLATSLNAKAFTVGEHVAFGAQEYRPGTLAGDALIAHELAHVAQQDAGAATSEAGYETLERDADLAGAGAVAALWGGARSFLRPAPRLRSGLRLQRCGGCGGKQAATTPAAAGPPAACEPTGASLSAVTEGAPFAETEVTLGYTRVDTAASQLQCRPQFAAGSTPGTCSFTPMPLRLNVISRYVKAGNYPHPQRRTMPSHCGELPIVFEITDPIADLAKQGEQEHCADIKLAFDRTLRPCSEALTRLAGTATAGRNPDECFADLVRKLGFNPAACTREFLQLRDASAQRDVKKWHTFEPYRISANCDTGALYRYRPARSNRIEEHLPSSAVVPDAPACSGPAPAPASPPAAAPASPRAATPEKETP
jgi:hypothetical protein